MIHATMRTFGIVYIDSLLHLLYANHPNTDKSKGGSMVPLVAMGYIRLVLLLFLLNVHEIYLKLKVRFRIIHKFPMCCGLDECRHHHNTCLSHFR
jgi:hypothetical protein